MTLDPHSPLRLQDALDGRLTAADRLAVGEHLVGCEPCRRTLHALRWTKVRMAGAGAVLPIPGRLETEVREALAQPAGRTGCDEAAAGRERKPSVTRVLAAVPRVVEQAQVAGRSTHARQRQFRPRPCRSSPS